jgi:hypothetical protein
MSENDNLHDHEAEGAEPETIYEARLWREGEWTARVIKNEDDDGWAVEMIKAGEQEPALVGPWTMGRDKKNPKPLDDGAFRTLVKTANEVLGRHAQQLRARLHKNVTIETDGGDVKVSIDITPDDFDPFATLRAENVFGELLGEARVEPNFKLTAESARRWAQSGFDRV